MDVLSLQGATLSTPVKGLFPSRVNMPMYMAGLIRSDVGFSGATGVSSLWQLVANRASTVKNANFFITYWFLIGSIDRTRRLSLLFLQQEENVRKPVSFAVAFMSVDYDTLLQKTL